MAIPAPYLAPALLSTLIPHHILLEAPKTPASYSSSDKPCSLIPPCFCSCCSSAWHALPLHLHLNISFLPSRYISWVFFLESLAQVPQVPIRGASSIFSVLDAHLYPYLFPYSQLEGRNDVCSISVSPVLAESLASKRRLVKTN